jgi:hypothetical protein
MLHLFWFDGWLFLYLWISEFSEAFLFFIIILPYFVILTLL